MLILNLQDGKVYDHPAAQSDGQLTTTISLPPGGSKLLFAHEDTYNASPAPFTAPASGGEKIIAQSVSITRNAPNVLPLDYCNLNILGKQFRDMYYIAATDSIYRFHGFDRASVDHNPWNFAVQYKQELVEQNNFPEGSGFTAEFPFSVTSGYVPSDMKLAVEWGHIYTITINGQPVEAPLNEEWLDNSINLYDISGLVQPGSNSITLQCRPMDIHAELERVFLVGDFDVQPSAGGFTVHSPGELEFGSWHNQGLPFYSKSVTYTQHIQVTEPDTPHIVHLPSWHGTVAAVRVNGNDAGIIGWKPYELNITKHLTGGENQIEVTVYGSFKNLLGPHHNVNRYGIVTPWSWNSAPASQPAGDNYDLFEYGLMENFQVMSYN